MMMAFLRFLFYVGFSCEIVSCSFSSAKLFLLLCAKAVLSKTYLQLYLIGSRYSVKSFNHGERNWHAIPKYLVNEK